MSKRHMSAIERYSVATAVRYSRTIERDTGKPRNFNAYMYTHNTIQRHLARTIWYMNTAQRSADTQQQRHQYIRWVQNDQSISLLLSLSPGNFQCQFSRRKARRALRILGKHLMLLAEFLEQHYFFVAMS